MVVPVIMYPGNVVFFIYRLFIMTDHDKQLLAELDYGIITTDIFLKNFSVDIKNDTDFVRTEMKNAIATSDPDEIK